MLQDTFFLRLKGAILFQYITSLFKSVVSTLRVFVFFSSQKLFFLHYRLTSSFFRRFQIAKLPHKFLQMLSTVIKQWKHTKKNQFVFSSLLLRRFSEVNKNRPSFFFLELFFPRTFHLPLALNEFLMSFRWNNAPKKVPIIVLKCFFNIHSWQ